MERWMRWVLAILIVAAIIALVTLARGVAGRHEITEAAADRACGLDRAGRRRAATPDPVDARPGADRASRRRASRSLLDALIPVVALIFLIALTIALFGTDATGGPLQVALFTSAVVAALVAFKNGHSHGQGPRRRGRRHHLRHERRLHPAGGRRPHRRLEHGRDHPDRRLLRRRAAQRDLVLPGDRAHLRRRRADHRQLLDHRGDARRRVRGARAAARREPGDHGRGGHLGRLLRRQDDADLRDDRARAVGRRRRDHPGARRRDDLDVRAGDPVSRSSGS